MNEYIPTAGDGTRTAEKITNLLWLSQKAAGDMLLLGCPISLTAGEMCVLEVIIKNHPRAVPAGQICERCGCLSPKSVPVHVNAINKKAIMIGGRKLISAQRGAGYTLNNFM